MEKSKSGEKSVFAYSQDRLLGLGLKSSIADQHKVIDSLWKRFNSRKKGRMTLRSEGVDHSAIFGLSYSPSGNVLVAACEKNSFTCMDPHTEKVITVKNDVHTDCCNSVTFLDDQVFMTCSDDSTIAVWDIRYLSSEVHRLHGHTSWVKNVETYKNSSQLISSGFDHKVLFWDLNVTDENGHVKCEELLTVTGLLRMKLSSDGMSMYIAGGDHGWIVAIHNLELSKLKNGLESLKMNDIGLPVSRNKKYQFQEMQGCEDHKFYPFEKQNQVEIYKSEKTVEYFYDNEGNAFPSYVRSHSMDVNKNNSALLAHHIGAEEKSTVVYNMKNHFNSDQILSANEIPHDSYILPRGTDTHILSQERELDGEFLEETVFSPCGKFFASPCGYGVCIAAFDEHLSDYETHMDLYHTRLPSYFEDDNAPYDQYPKTLAVPVTEEAHIVKMSFGHSHPVLCSSFSPTHLQLATGCEGGLVLFHNPVL